MDDDTGPRERFPGPRPCQAPRPMGGRPGRRMRRTTLVCTMRVTLGTRIIDRPGSSRRGLRVGPLGLVRATGLPRGSRHDRAERPRGRPPARSHGRPPGRCPRRAFRPVRRVAGSSLRARERCPPPPGSPRPRVCRPSPKPCAPLLPPLASSPGPSSRSSSLVACCEMPLAEQDETLVATRRSGSRLAGSRLPRHAGGVLRVSQLPLLSVNLKSRSQESAVEPGSVPLRTRA